MRYMPIVAKMALRNVFKYGRRSVETFVVVFVGVAAVALVDAFLNGFADKMVSGLAVSGGHVGVSAPGYAARRAICPLDKLVADPRGVAERAERAAFAAGRAAWKDPRFRAVVALPSLRAPVALRFGDRSANAYATGADAALPGGGAAPPFRNRVFAAGRYPEPGERGIVLSEREADRLGARLGDRVIALANDAYGSFGAVELPLLGVTRSDPGPDSCLVDLDSMRAFLGVETGAAELALFLVDAAGSPVDPRKVPEAVRAMETAAAAEGLEARRWDAAGSVAGALLAFFDSFIYAMYAIFVIVAAAGIANSVLLSVQDRTRDFATLRAVAFPASWVKAIVALETLIVGAAASLAAVAAAILVIAAMGPEGLRLSESTRGIAEWMPLSIPARVDPVAFALIFLGGCAAPLAAAAYPLRVLGRLNIREGLGYV